MTFLFDPFELDPPRRRLTASGEPVACSDRQLDILIVLVARAGQIVAKDDLLDAAWKDVAVGDNSLEQAISSLRRLLARHAGPVPYIETVPRRGYRFSVTVTRRAQRESDAGIEALLAPHRAFVEGRAALETLEADQIAHARAVFEGALRTVPDHASAHLGLANACIMQFEMTRADSAPDVASLGTAVAHAREACRLDSQSGEAWATLGFALDRVGERLDALAACKRAVTLEPDNWRHHFRLSYVSWGEERLRAAHRTLTLLPDFPLAHWLAATVHVARQAFAEAERELTAAVAVRAGHDQGEWKFSAIGVHWLAGLIHLAHGNEALAGDDFERELASEHAGHLYARECGANTWHAIGALRLRQGRHAEARQAFAQALERVASHPFARLGLVAAGGASAATVSSPAMPVTGHRPGSPAPAVDAALYHAGLLVLSGQVREASHVVSEALASAPPGNAGWILPVEPLLHVSSRPDEWAHALAQLRNRAA